MHIVFICRVAWWGEIPLLNFIFYFFTNSYYRHSNEIVQHLQYDVGNQHIGIFRFPEYVHLSPHFFIACTKVQLLPQNELYS